MNITSAWYANRQQRWRVPAGTTIYVDGNSGSDANDGLDASKPLATIQVAINRIKQDLDLANVGTPLVVQLAAGTYSGGGNPVLHVSGPFVGHNPTGLTFPSAYEVPVLIRGDVANPSNVVLTSGSDVGTILCMLGGVIGLEGVKLVSTGSNCIRTGAGIVIYGNVILGAAPLAKIFTSHGSVVESYGTTWLEGNSDRVFCAEYQSSIYITGIMSLLGNMAGTAFAWAGRVSLLDFVNATIERNGFDFTGRKYLTGQCSCIKTGTGNVNFLPGTTEGARGGFSTYDDLTQ